MSLKIVSVVTPKKKHKTPEKLTQKAAKILSHVNSRAKCVTVQEKSLDPSGKAISLFFVYCRMAFSDFGSVGRKKKKKNAKSSGARRPGTSA